MRTALICHHDNPINRHVLPAWLASCSDLVGVVIITETFGRKWKRLRFEWRRSRWRILDVLAYRVYHRLALAHGDSAWVGERVAALARKYPAPSEVPVLHTSDPNDPATGDFLRRIAPDVVVARCKSLLRPEIFEVPRAGTIVLHPGICPEYRNAHGCFWALAQRDLQRVGATMLRIDKGVDTGPVFGYYRTSIDERTESPAVIEHRVVLDNLGPIAADLSAVVDGGARPIDISGRTSATWGQPRLSNYLRWKWAARRGGR